jgi:hypothetical protein
LGKVAGVSEVTLKWQKPGQPLVRRSYLSPWRVWLNKAANTLSIKLTTTLGNYMSTVLKDNKDTIKWLVKVKSNRCTRKG